MKMFSARHPILFQVVLFIAAIFLAVFFALLFQVVFPLEEKSEDVICAAIGRLLAGGLLFLVFIRSFKLKRQFSGFVVMLPALLFAAWNLFRYFLTKGGSVDNYVYAIVLGLAPAVFEEVLFRGIFIRNLKASGKKPLSILLISSLFFGLVHVTNFSLSVINMSIQVGSAIVVGLVFGAIYIKTEDLVSIIIAHAAIDICDEMFPVGGLVLPGVELTGFLILLAVETWYAFWLMSRSPRLPEALPDADAQNPESRLFEP